MDVLVLKSQIVHSCSGSIPLRDGFARDILGKQCFKTNWRVPRQWYTPTPLFRLQ